MSRARMRHSSTTRLVEAISKAMAAVKAGAFAETGTGRDTAAYGMTNEVTAAPKTGPMASVPGRSSPSTR